MGSTFHLKCELHGHKEDVRGVCTTPNLGIITGSRDTTICLWTSPEGEKGLYEISSVFIGHSSFVGPVVYVPPGEKLPEGGIVSGGMDKRVLVWDVKSAAIVSDLQGHEQQVTSVAVAPNMDIVSGSLDKTVRVWRNGVCVEVLSGHSAPVLSVLVLPTGEIVSGSGDTTIKVWRAGAGCISTLKAHTDSVRGLALLPGSGREFLSASHDGTLRRWALSADGTSAQPVAVMTGHTALVYNVATSEGLVASASEDRTARVWTDDGQCMDTIEHPGCVWDVAFLPSGDLVTACSDGVARVWTMDPSRAASEAEIKAYSDLLAEKNSRSKTVNGVKVEDLPGVETLETPGAKDGQTVIVREGGSACAYSWNAKEYKWDKIGEVVDGPGEPAAGNVLNGVTYDFVFDVAIEDGAPARKLPYNRGDNPYDVADRWLLEQGLPGEFRSQVVDFIIQNTGQAEDARAFDVPDPFTGGGAYVPQGPAWQRPGQGRAPSAAPSGFPAGGIPDPFTGGNAYVPGGADSGGGFSASKTPQLVHLPKRGMLYFDTAAYDGIWKKLQEFNSALQAAEETKGLALGAGDLARLEAILATLKDTAHFHSSTFADVDFALLSRLLHSWPPPNLFPVLDVLRMMVLHPDAASRLAAEVDKGQDLLSEVVKRANEAPALAPNQLTSLRVVVNAFRHRGLRNWASNQRGVLLDLFAPCASSTNKNIRLSLATLVLNYAVDVTEGKNEEGQLHTLTLAVELAHSEQDPEALFRELVAIGTLIHSGSVKALAVDLEIGSIVEKGKKSTTAKIVEVSKDIEGLLK